MRPAAAVALSVMQAPRHALGGALFVVHVLRLLLLGGRRPCRHRVRSCVVCQGNRCDRSPGARGTASYMSVRVFISEDSSVVPTDPLSCKLKYICYGSTAY